MNRLLELSLVAAFATSAVAHETDGIVSDKTAKVDAAFDLVHTRVSKDGDLLVFEQLVDGLSLPGTWSAD